MPILKSILRRGLTAIGLAALASCATPSAEAPGARPALWEVTDADTRIYLFGTIHLLPANYQWRSPTFDKALGESHSLVVETVVDEKNPQTFMAEMGRLGFSPGQPPIAERVPAEKRAALNAAIAKSGMPLEMFDRMETWAAAFLLLGGQFEQLGLSGGDGVEAVLRKQFAQSGRPVEQLESITEQLSIFDALPEQEQRSFLEGVIEEPETMREQFGDMLKAWVNGDIEAIARTFNRDLETSPAMKDGLIRRRNANWSKWVERRMESPGTVMLAVGAGHLAGPDSVVSMLKRSGYRVRRVQ